MTKTTDDALDYLQVAELLARLGLQHSPAGWHGLLCGALCVDEARHVDVVHLADGDTPIVGDTAAREALAGILARTQRALHEAQEPFQPLLPADGAVLEARARALAEWCEGFVFSLGGRHRFDLAACSPDVQEIVRDFTELTRAEFGTDNDEEEEENAYAELVEYARVGAQLVYVELRRGRGSTAGRKHAGRTIH